MRLDATDGCAKSVLFLKYRDVMTMEESGKFETDAGQVSKYDARECGARQLLIIFPPLFQVSEACTATCETSRSWTLADGTAGRFSVFGYI